ncbi:MAG: hypothetical protein RLZZ488_2357 [Pseudomonadota bacterium]|jgi:hypothetical protein
MTTDNKQNQQSRAWKSQVSAFYGEKSVRPAFRDSLRETLLNTPVFAAEPEPKASLSAAPARNWWPAILLSSLVSAAVAASVTFLLVATPFDDPADPIAELTQLPGPRVYPPDFDLEGDSLAMQDIVFDLFADKDFFVSKLPAQVLAEYKPSEGRFFSWDGEPAVSIQMNKSNPQELAKLNPDPATLFIVKLSEKSQRKFPKEKTTRKLAGKAGKMHKVKIWREGKYGYAMVQSVAVTESTP